MQLLSPAGPSRGDSTAALLASPLLMVRMLQGGEGSYPGVRRPCPRGLGRGGPKQNAPAGSGAQEVMRPRPGGSAPIVTLSAEATPVRGARVMEVALKRRSSRCGGSSSAYTAQSPPSD